MLRPDLPVKTPGRGNGTGAGEAAVVGDHGADSAMQGTDGCQCRLNPSGCLVCRRWDRTIRGIEARRADVLRMQATWPLAQSGR